jgi:hypothetical protein
VAKDHRVAFLHEFFYQANEDVYVSHVFRHTLIGLLFLEGLEIPAATEAYESLEMAAAQMVRRRLNQVEAIEGIVRGAVKLGRDKFYLTLTEFRKLFSSQQNIRKTIVGVEAERLFEYILSKLSSMVRRFATAPEESAKKLLSFSLREHQRNLRAIWK